MGRDGGGGGEKSLWCFLGEGEITVSRWLVGGDMKAFSCHVEPGANI